MAFNVQAGGHLAAVYKRFNAPAVLKKARISRFDLTSANRRKYVVTSDWESSDVSRKERCKFVQSAVLTVEHDLGTVRSEFVCEPSFVSLGNGFPFSDQNGARVLWSIAAPDSGLRAVCVEYMQSAALSAASRASKACAPVSGCFVQIWLHGNLLNTIKLPNTGDSAQHGKVYPNFRVAFSGAAWSFNSKEIVYTAEGVANPETKISDDDSDYQVFRHDEDWGEGLHGVRRTVLCLLNVSSGQVSRLVDEEKLPGVAPSGPIWCPNERGIVFLGYALRAYNLGVKYCTQRPCRLYHLDIDSGHLLPLSDPNQSARCPSFSPDGKCLVWLEDQVGGPHQQCSVLKALQWPTTDGVLSRTVVPRVESPEQGSMFPGLYGDLPERCWSSDSQHVIMSSIWGFQLVALLIRVNLQEEQSAPTFPAVVTLLPSIDELPNKEEPRSVSVLDVYEDVVCASFNSVTTPPVLAVLSLRPVLQRTNNPDSNPEWLIISSSEGLFGADARLRLSGVSQYQLNVSVSEVDSSEYVSALLVCPKSIPQTRGLEVVDLFGDESQKLQLIKPLHPPHHLHGLIVWPHGGPHSAFTGSWSPVIAGFVASGFACLLVNYRGSLGYGDLTLRSLLGYIGRKDVADCVTATKWAHNKLRELFGAPVPTVLFGGSHGGFLVLHLAARYPSLYRAVVARNPVVNLATMVDTSDIPDWCFAEAGILNTDSEWTLSHITDLEDFKKFRAMSPLNQLKPDWSAPLLLLLGAKDRRVPMSQGLTFYRKLKALCPKVPCEVMIFPHDAHPLESPAASAASFIETVTWFIKHLQEPDSA
ncbi:Acylaminoacyl-peptidase (S09 family) [Fasciola gigantica]|uniref:Acylamino-acid-releasing enzyme n=1 Tax=Fasciola gigantica TaxID=46835 RepID=A0A504YWE4_FASGI|nr:Acylaminoacyl-peptidase (S09 family) [Fasciola gigantica]